MKKTIYVFIDMQNDFLTGVLGSNEGQAVIPHVANQLKTAVEKKQAGENCEIYLTKDTHYDNYMDTMEGKKLPVPHCIKGTDGWEICPELLEVMTPDCKVIEKVTFGYDGWKNILGELAPEDEIVIMGVCTDICVISNTMVLKALYPNNVITVDAAGCAGVTPEQHNGALAQLKICHIDVINE